MLFHPLCVPHIQFRVTVVLHIYDMYVFELCEKIGVPTGNPHRHRPGSGCEPTAFLF